MLHVVAAAVLATLELEGSVVSGGGDYEVVEFEVPAGTAEIEVAHSTLSEDNILDWGLWSPMAFRGWGGGSGEPAVVAVAGASRGYLPGPIETGTWRVVIGKAKLASEPADYHITITFRDQETVSPTEEVPFTPRVLSAERRWYAGDFHVHSHQSGDATASLDDIVGLVRERNLDFVALTDHNTIAQHSEAAARQLELDDVLLIRGSEITTYGGHLNGLGISSYVDHRVGLDGRTAADVIGDVVAQGGLVSINHPTITLGNLCIGCEWVHDDTPWDQVSAMEIQTGNFEAVGGLFTPRAIEMWDGLLDAGYRITAVGGSDDHDAGIGLDSNQSPIGSPTTMVLADELSEAAILDEIRAGRVVVKLRSPDDPMVELEVRGDGGETGIVGDTVSGSTVDASVHVTGGAGLTLAVINTTGAESLPIDSDDWTGEVCLDVAPGGDRVRAEVLDGGLSVVVTNHVFLEHVAGGGCSTARGGNGAGWLVWLLLAVGMVRRHAMEANSDRDRSHDGGAGRRRLDRLRRR